MSDGKGQLLNCNADSVASCLAKACARVAETHLVYCFEMPGVMRDIDDPKSVISSITPESYTRLRAEGVVSKGMIPKIDGSIAAVEAGVRTVTIKARIRPAETVGNHNHPMSRPDEEAIAPAQKLIATPSTSRDERPLPESSGSGSPTTNTPRPESTTISMLWPHRCVRSFLR